jgi:hypothetical protein
VRCRPQVFSYCGLKLFCSYVNIRTDTFATLVPQLPKFGYIYIYIYSGCYIQCQYSDRSICNIGTQITKIHNISTYNEEPDSRAFVPPPLLHPGTPAFQASLASASLLHEGGCFVSASSAHRQARRWLPEPIRL